VSSRGPHPLDGCWAKVNRAWEHFHALEAEILTAPEYMDAVAFGQQFDSQRNVVTVTVTGVPDLPLRWATMATDCLQNFRSALNYLVWELSRWNLAQMGISKNPNWRTQFPFWTEPGQFPIKQIPNVNPTHQTVLKGLQPMTESGLRRTRLLPRPMLPPDVITSLAFYHPLTLLRKLTNTDKHKVLPLLIAGVAGGTFMPSVGIRCTVRGSGVVASHALKLGAVWAEFDVIPEGPNPEVDVKHYVTLKVAFEDGRVVETTIPEIGAIVLGMIREFEPVF
jgi:hypothetical protein